MTATKATMARAATWFACLSSRYSASAVTRKPAHDTRSATRATRKSVADARMLWAVAAASPGSMMRDRTCTANTKGTLVPRYNNPAILARAFGDDMVISSPESQQALTLEHWRQLRLQIGLLDLVAAFREGIRGHIQH